MGHNFVSTEQILLGLLNIKDNIVSKSLNNYGLTILSTREAVEKIIGRGNDLIGIEIPFTPLAKKLLELSFNKSKSLGIKYIAPEHLLLALLELDEGVAIDTLRNSNINIKSLKNSVTTLMNRQILVKTVEATKPSIVFNNSNRENKEIKEIKEKLEKLEKQFQKTATDEKIIKCNCIFIGHGRSPLWNRINTWLKDSLKLNDVIYFESECRAGHHVGNILNEFLDKATFAIIIMTAEDETAGDEVRARQNVIHEIGLFQGKLGFNKVAILKQDTVQPFSNIDGLQYIPFTGDNIPQTFWELQEMLKREGFLN